jgi:alkylhydroperoxidase family enzyme
MDADATHTARVEAMDPLDELRVLAAGSSPPPAALEAYLQKVRGRAYTVTDAEVEALTASGLTEDEIFEHTVAAALDEGIRRLDAAFAAIDA